MATTAQDITNWFERGNSQEHSHMIVVTDTYDYDDFPVHIARDSDIKENIKKYDGENMMAVTEVYSYDLPLEPQLAEHRAWNLYP